VVIAFAGPEAKASGCGTRECHGLITDQRRYRRASFVGLTFQADMADI
jgi:hypothetical protein